MANKKLYLSNLSAQFGPSELAGLGGTRALVLGRYLNLTGDEFDTIREYFSVIISEDYDFSLSLKDSLPPDVEFWQPGSPYVSSVFRYPVESDVLYMTNFRTLRAMAGLQHVSRTYNLAYLPGGSVGSLPAVVRELPIGLDELAVGVHLAKVMGCTEVWDSEGRAGTTLANENTILSMMTARDKYGVGENHLGKRLSLLNQI